MAEIPQVKLSHNLCDAHLNVNKAGDVMQSPETLWNRRRRYGIAGDIMESPGLHFYKQERKSYDTGTTYGIT